MTKFRNIPEPPYATNQEDLNWFQGVKYNLEILMRQREDDDSALLRSDVKLLKVPDPQLKGLKTGQQGVGINNTANVQAGPPEFVTIVSASGATKVPTLEEYKQLQEDTDKLRQDVTVLRTYVNSLILQLRGREE